LLLIALMTYFVVQYPRKNTNPLLMRHHLVSSIPVGSLVGTSLQQLINSLTGEMVKSSHNNRNIVINEITSDVILYAEECRIAPVLEELLGAVISNGRNGRIYINAERFRDMITIEIEERNTYNGYALAYSINALEPIARLAGGYIAIKGQQQLTTTISFSFPNLPGNYAHAC